MGNAEARAAAGYHPRWGGRYDSREDRSPTPEPPGTRVFSWDIRMASFPQRFRQPTSIDKYTGETVSAIKPYEGFGDVDHTIKKLMSL
jgi:hypothetical protein